MCESVSVCVRARASVCMSVFFCKSYMDNYRMVVSLSCSVIDLVLCCFN